LTISNALEGKPLPLYGKGQNIRDWLFVKDHVRALYKVVTEGLVGETYNIGGNNEKTNLEVVSTICNILDDITPKKNVSYKNLITFVSDRPGHDFRYAIDSNKIYKNLGWTPLESFETGIFKTVEWYLQNQNWYQKIKNN